MQAAAPAGKAKKSVRWASTLVEVREYELDQEEKNDKQRKSRGLQDCVKG